MRALILGGLAGFTLAAAAQTPPLVPLAPGEKEALTEKIRQIKTEAGQRKDEAERAYKAREAECYGKFLVNACLDEAKEGRRLQLNDARTLEQQGRSLEQELKKRDYLTREQRRQEEAPRHEAEAAAEAEKNRIAREEALRRIEERQAATPR